MTLGDESRAKMSRVWGGEREDFCRAFSWISAKVRLSICENRAMRGEVCQRRSTGLSPQSLIVGPATSVKREKSRIQYQINVDQNEIRGRGAGWVRVREDGSEHLLIYLDKI